MVASCYFSSDEETSRPADLCLCTLDSTIPTPARLKRERWAHSATCRPEPMRSQRTAPRLLVLGTSNCILQDSFPGILARQGDVVVCNKSVGASALSFATVVTEGLDLRDFDVVVLDNYINDAGMLHAGIRAADELFEVLQAIVYRVREAGAIPLILGLPTESQLEQPSPFESMMRRFAAAFDVCLLDLCAVLRFLKRKGVPVAELMRDPSHLSPGVQKALALFVREFCFSARRARLVTKQANYNFGQFFVFYPGDFKGEVVRRSSSLCSGVFSIVNEHCPLSLDVQGVFDLWGMLLNSGAPGAHAEILNCEQRFTKNLVFRWSDENPQWFTAQFVDFKSRKAHSGSFQIHVKPEPLLVVDEESLHSRTPLPGRYGSLEVGAIVFKSGRSKAWLEVPEPSATQDNLGRGFLKLLARQASFRGYLVGTSVT